MFRAKANGRVLRRGFWAMSLAVLAGALGLAACETDSGSGSPPENVGSAIDKLQVGPRLPHVNGDNEEGEGSFELEEQRLAGYVHRRAFPNDQISVSRHATALTQLAAMRVAQARPHFDPDAPPAPVGACDATCNEGQECLFGACRDHCGTGEFRCGGGLCTFRSADGCFCVPCDGPGGGGGPGGPGAPGCGWMPSGPTNVPGRVMALAFDPGDSNRLFAGTVGGLWLSGDQGRRWQRSRIGASTRLVSDIGFNTTTREIFVAMSDQAYRSRGDGVWSSPSGATDTFTKVSDGTVDMSSVYRVIAQPGVNGDVYVATTGGIFVGTRPAGTFTWTLLDGMNAVIDDMEITFTTTPPTVYAGVTSGTATFASGIWKHDGSGWAKRDGGITLGSTERVGLTLVTSSPQTLYARIATSTTTFDLYKTTDGAATNWQALPNAALAAQPLEGGGYPWYNTLLQADPNNANIAYFGNVLLYGTTDGGATWARVDLGTDPAFGLGIHADQHSMTFDPSNSRIVYAGNDGGIYKSTDTSAATWHWTTRAHGMQTTEFYRLTSQVAGAGLIAGGAQDNGTNITFGNRTWYEPGGCDGTDVASDASNSSTLYSHCNGSLFEIINPVPYTPGGNSAICAPAADGSCGCAACWVFPAGTTPNTTSIGRPVLVTADPTIGGTALMRGVSTTTPGQELVMKTTDGINWTTSLTPAGTSVSALAIAGSATNPKYYYVGATDATFNGVVYVSSDSGATWTSTSLGAAISRANAIAIDPVTPTRAFVASGAPGQLAQTTDAGATWTALTPVDAAHTMPAAAAVTGVAIDAPGNRLFAATDVGVFVGALSGANSVSWEPFDDGLPDGVDVNDIYLNPQTSTLFIGTWGLGGYHRSIAAGTCPSVELMVRDSVFDEGQAPTPSGLPDPEHPIADAARPPFYKPDDTTGGRVYFWESTDIRVDVPSLYNAAYQFSTVDHVEFESCPSSIASCPPWLLTHVDPRRGQLANVYVQMHNRGLAPASNVRVVAMYTDASAGVPPLPANFWTQTAVPGAPGCGALDESTGWKMVGCGSVAEVNQRVPEVKQFAWNVPAATAEHTCMLTIVDSADDPVTNTTTDTEAATIGDRHVAHRNLHVIDGPGAAPGTGGPAAGGSPSPGIPFSGLSTLYVPNRWNAANTHRVLLSRSGMEPTGRLSFLLPNGVAGSTPGLPPKCGVSATTTGAVTISLPRGMVAGSLALSADGMLDLGDRASVVGADGQAAPIADAGTGQLRVGVYAVTGSVSARGSVFLAERATVRGDVKYQGGLTRQNYVTVTGAVQQTGAFSPSDALSWVVQYPNTSNGDRNVNSGQVLSEAPGRFGTIQVNSGGKLRLSSGTYYLEALRIESTAVLELQQTSGPTIIYTRQGFTFRGTERTAAGSGTPELLVVAIGSSDVAVETPLIGSVIAPTAKLTLGGGTGRYRGSFFGRDVVVRPGIIVELRPSAAFQTLAACRALTSAEVAKATGAGLAPDQYSVGAVELYQNWPIPFGQRWKIGLRYDSGLGRTGTAGRFRVISLLGNTVKGGNTFLLRQ